MLLLLLFVLYNKTSIMKQLWSVLFLLSFSDVCSFFFPFYIDNSRTNRTDTIVKISSFALSHCLGSLYSPSVSDWPYPCSMYIFIRVIRNTRLRTGWRRKTNDMNWCMIPISKANVDHHASQEEKRKTEDNSIRKQIRLLDC